MLSKLYSASTYGTEAYLVEIEVDVSRGLPAISVVGLPDEAVRESRDRVKNAIRNSGYEYPAGRITVNLAPADIKKGGSSFDLAIALGILASSGQISCEALKDFVFLGELSLSGGIRRVSGALPVSLFLRDSTVKKLIVPKENSYEAAIIKEIDVYPVDGLRETVYLIANFLGKKPLRLETGDLIGKREYEVDFSEVKGQYSARRALEVAASGSHNILFIGPPGSGKSMLAKRIPTIMPDLTLEEALEVTKIHSVAGILSSAQGLINLRPFRSPNHGISSVAMVGGGSIPQPGEISLAHQGVLFLDELPEFRRDCLEALRQPLEEGLIRISRIKRSLVFPASFMLVAAMNPCPCGLLGQIKSNCRCNTTQIARYRAKISGPLLDRVDMHLEVPAVRYKELSSPLPAESSAQIKKRVNRARFIQRERFSNEGIFHNAQMSHKQVRRFCILDKEGGELFKMAMAEFNFSARAYDKILKVSRTIADLAESEVIKTEHLSEAIGYRSLDREFFV